MELAAYWFSAIQSFRLWLPLIGISQIVIAITLVVIAGKL
jgi:hypothetical protein